MHRMVVERTESHQGIEDKMCFWNPCLLSKINSQNTLILGGYCSVPNFRCLTQLVSHTHPILLLSALYLSDVSSGDSVKEPPGEVEPYQQRIGRILRGPK